ncbi:MAG: 30S ribosomal protein S9 [Lentisphaerae bacterium]|nr:30S ribosomal protein S9 [Lentisphaerota bacterium]
MPLKTRKPLILKNAKEKEVDAIKSEIVATGRRKNAVASVRLRAGTGQLTINRRAFQDYFPVAPLRNFVLQPLKLTNTDARFDIRAKLHGGGLVGQAGALRHGIARALVAFDGSLPQVLKSSGFLTRDARIKERKKTGQPGARKRFQFSKR